MSVFQHGSRATAIGVIGLLVIGALVPFCISKRQKLTRRLVCNNCGEVLWASTDGLAGAQAGGTQQRSFQATELSGWFRSHITTNCTHTWVQIHSSGRTYYALCGRGVYDIVVWSGGQVTPHLTWLYADDRAQLESLLKESPTKCSNFIHETLQREISGTNE